jgi:hypothetical protein
LLYQRAQEFDATIAVTEPNDASNPSDDNMIAIFEDHGDDPVLKKRTSFASNPRSEVSESSALSDQVDGLPSLNLWSPPPSLMDVSTSEVGREVPELD